MTHHRSFFPAGNLVLGPDFVERDAIWLARALFHRIQAALNATDGFQGNHNIQFTVLTVLR